MQDLSVISVLLLLTGFLFSAALLYVTIISLLENERRAALRAFMLILPLIILSSLPVMLQSSIGDWFAIASFLLIWLFIGLLVFPTRLFERKIKGETPVGQINEKTVMFSRNLYQPGSKRYKDYYSEFPDHEAPDNHFRSKPGLLSDRAAFYDPFTFNSSKAIFESITAFYPILDEDPNPEKSSADPEMIASSIQKWILKEGAISVGFTTVHDYHWYSVIGRGKDFGKEAQLPHTHAIAFTVEMDKELMDTAPLGPTVMESARQYMNAAVIAIDVAKFIRNLGYQARAHIDGNYRLICPLVARDAGLGEIGRMGLLMSPELGPRVRIGVVTTDLPLPSIQKKDYSDMIKFCKICKKCADVCPSGAIPHNDRKNIEGVKRWQIDQESCYTYWCIAGTDCGKCMSDCPYSHPDNFFHNLVRKMLRNSLIFRYFALKMDDFFYGRKPKTKPIPNWLQMKNEERKSKIEDRRS